MRGYQTDSSRQQDMARLAVNEKLAASVPSQATLEALAQKCASKPSIDATFEYAFCLTKSSSSEERRYSIKILRNLVNEGYAHQVDCIYGIAIALYLNGECDKARRECEAILRAEPEHLAATELHLACLDAISKEDAKQMEKMAVGAGVAVAGLGLAMGMAGLFFGKKR